MKKVVLSMFIMLMGVFFAACSGSDAADLKSVVESAQKDGSNWTADQWKDAYKVVMKAAKPMLVDLKEMQKKAESASDEDKMKLFGEMTEKMKSYEELSKQMEAFQSVAEKSEVAKKVLEDKNFEKEIAKELGMEDLIGE